MKLYLKKSKLFKSISILVAISMITIGFFGMGTPNIKAATNYPYQAMEIVSQVSGSKVNLNIKGYSNNSNVNTWYECGNSNERWKFVTSDGIYFKLVNEKTNLLLSTSNWAISSGTSCVLYENQSRDEQLWRIIGVNQDNYGNYYDYKIVNKSNTNLALTLDETSYLTKLETYSGANNQLWKLDCDGLDGFAGYCEDMNGNEKAGTIGGLLGQTVEVNTVAAFYAQTADDIPRTVIVTGNLDTGLEVNEHFTIGGNKTIIGAYGVSLKDFYLTTNHTNESAGSDNIIIKNIKFVNSYGTGGNTPLNIEKDSKNVWLDHNTVVGNLDTESQYIEDSGTLYTTCKSLRVNEYADFVTVSYNKFLDRFYTLLIGWPSDDYPQYSGYPRITFNGNYIENCNQRCPRIRWATVHFINNYEHNVGLGMQPGIDANFYSESNRFEDVDNILYDQQKGAGNNKFTDVGSYPTITSTIPAATWVPSEHYSYKKLDAHNESSYDVKSFCTTYAGAATSASGIEYISHQMFEDSWSLDSSLNSVNNTNTQ